jgi:hypothetical protein
MNMYNIIKNISKQRGYTLLFSVLTATLVLGVAVFILSVSRKQYILASTARNSMFSIYAADSGIECASLNYAGISSAPTTFTFNCGTNSKSVSFTQFSYTDPSGQVHDNAYEADFNIGFKDSGVLIGCAGIKVISYLDESNNTNTIIKSRGYNVCKSDFTPDTTNPRIVERALQVVYQ